MSTLIQVDAAEVDEFDQTIAAACQAKSAERLNHQLPTGCDPSAFSVPDYFRSQGALVLSFDAQWFPFLDNTVGYNRTPQRWYVPKTSQLIRRVALHMQTPAQRSRSPMPGGRTFFRHRGAFRRIDGKRIEVLAWNFAKDSVFLASSSPGPKRYSFPEGQ